MVLPHAGVPKIADDAWWSWAGVAVPSDVWKVSASIDVVALVVGGDVVVPRPGGGREGRPWGRRLRVGSVPRGPRSRGELSVLWEEGDRGVTEGGASTAGGVGASSRLV